MAKNAFDKNLPKRCEYCAFSGKIGTEELLCSKKGITDPGDCCRHYRYDPLKRVPVRRRIGKDFSPEDFKL